MTDGRERTGALEAVERIVNRGGPDVAAEALESLRRACPSVELRGGRFVAEGASTEELELLDRATVLASHHLT